MNLNYRLGSGKEKKFGQKEEQYYQKSKPKKPVKKSRKK